MIRILFLILVFLFTGTVIFTILSLKNGEKIGNYSTYELNNLCEQELIKIENYPTIDSYLLRENSEEKYYQIKISAINGFKTFWQLLTFPKLEQNNTFAIEPNNQQTIRTVPISPESFNEKNTLSYQLTFSFAFLSKEKENSFSLNQPYGMFPVKGKSFVSQVHNGGLLAKVLKLNNHNLLTEEYAIDIGAPLGSNVLAFDNGTIMWKEDNFGDYGCARTRYISQGNALKILHDNGTESLYLHLKQDSIIVEVGQKVEKGQIIAKVGASGYTSTPQLHFQLGAMTNEGVRTIPLKFQLLSSDALWVPKLLTNVTNEKN